MNWIDDWNHQCQKFKLYLCALILQRLEFFERGGLKERAGVGLTIEMLSFFALNYSINFVLVSSLAIIRFNCGDKAQRGGVQSIHKCTSRSPSTFVYDTIAEVLLLI